MNFLVNNKSLESGIQQVVFGRSDNPGDPIDFIADTCNLRLEATGTRADVRIQCEEGGRVRISVADALNLKKLSSTYKKGLVRVRFQEGRIRLQNSSIALVVCETESIHDLIDFPIDASLTDILALPAIYSEQEIADSGLQEKVASAKKQVENLILGATSDLSALGVSPEEVKDMVGGKINERIEVNRRVLRPESLSSDWKAGQKPSDESGSSGHNNNGEEIMNEAEMRTELERLRAENAQLRIKGREGISPKVSDKGAVSLYGVGRFPVTLYKEQWLRVLDATPEIRKFIQENDSRLKTKAQ